jgi:hypothetical protein
MAMKLESKVRREVKDVISVVGLSLFVAYLALYFLRSDLGRVRSEDEWMIVRTFQTRAELVMSIPLLKIEGFLRPNKFFGYATDGPELEAN